MKVVSSLVAGDTLSSPVIRLVTAGMVCYLTVVFQECQMRWRGTHVHVFVVKDELLSGRGVRQFLLSEVAQPPGIVSAWSCFSHVFTFPLYCSSVQDDFEFLENFKPKMSSWCPHTTVNLWLLDEFSVKRGRCSVTLLGKRSFCLQPVCRIAGVWVVIGVLSWLLDKQTLHRPAFGFVYICTVMIYA